MRNNHSAAGKVFETFLKGPESIYINIVSRFIKKKNICP